MLLTDFKAVTEIDNKIDLLHKKLGDLYQLRANYALETTKPNTPTSVQTQAKVTAWDKTAGTATAWAQQQYDVLANSWALYDIEVPAFKQLKAQLLKANRIMQALEADHAELVGKLSVLLTPPAKLIDSSKNETLRGKQDFIKAIDYTDPELRQTASNKWQVLVVYSAPLGLLFGGVETILDDKAYMLSGYDTRGLGILEYKALSLQTLTSLDEDSWTLLLKNYRPSAGQPVPSAACLNGQYRFEADDIAGLLGEERFRPAVQVKL